MTQSAAIGLIVGHGYTKIQGPGGTTCFPSVATPAPTHEGHLVDTPFGAPRPTVITLDGRVYGSEWIAGAVALSTAPNRLVSILDRAQPLAQWRARTGRAGRRGRRGAHSGRAAAAGLPARRRAEPGIGRPALTRS